MSRSKVFSEVTGSVWKIEATIGESLAVDDTVMVVESMKMEIPITTPDAGKLVEILVQEGEAIESGQPVAVIER